MGKLRDRVVAAVGLVGVSLGSLLSFAQVPEAWQVGRQLDDATSCTAGVDDGCLEHVRGVLAEGSSPRRVPGLEWTLRPRDGDWVSVLLPPRQSGTLAPYAGREVGGWVHDGDLVAVLLPGGTEVRAVSVGLPGVALFAGFGAVLVGLSLTGLAHRLGPRAPVLGRVGRPVLVLALVVVALAWFATPVWLVAGTGATSLLLAWGLLHGHVLPPARRRDGRPRSHQRCWWCALVGAPDCAARRAARARA